MSTLTTEARYEHDCPDCVFLGRWEGYDLWVHPIGMVTVIARYGVDGEYASGMEFVGKHPALTEAKRRADQRGLLL